MANRVLILQSSTDATQYLSEYFIKRGDKVFKAENPERAIQYLKNNMPALALIDLHLPGNGWLEVLTVIHQDHPNTKVMVTNKYPDVRREFLAKEQGVHVFLREPFAPTWIERALKSLEAGGQEPPSVRDLPRVRFSMRLKITIPYAILALMISLAAAYLVSRFVLDSMHERFMNQLVDSGKLSADWMVTEENRLLRTLRQLSNTGGVAEDIQSGDAQALRNLVLPTIINQQEEALEILNMQGVSVLSLRHLQSGGREDYLSAQGSREFASLGFVQNVLQSKIDAGRDKYAGLANVDGFDVFYIAGPVYNSNNNQVGVVMVGKTLPTMIRQNRQATMAQISIYRTDGSILVTTLLVQKDIQPLSGEQIRTIIALQDEASEVRDLQASPVPLTETSGGSNIRDISVASSHYSELLGPWEARGGEDLGVIGVSLAESSLIQPTFVTRVQAFLIVALGFLGIVLMGIFLANQITQPLEQVVVASSKIAQGNLEVKVPARGNDEVAVVAHAFNYMISGLQEGFMYRDLLGRTVSPEVREALRASFASGDLRLEGQSTEATVLMSDIRGFTSLSEKVEPTTILNWLNEYFGELVPIVTSYGGVVDKFEGDAMLAFFGILPKPLPPEESSFHACQAAVEMLAVVERINARRVERGEPPLVTGVGINTGKLTAGSLGTSDRLNYTIIGDTVNTVQRLQEVTRRFGESGVVLNETTITALKGRRGDFRVEPLGEHSIPGKRDQLWLYRLLPKVRDR